MPTKPRKILNCYPDNYDSLSEEEKARYANTEDMSGKKLQLISQIDGLDNFYVITSNENIVNTLIGITADSRIKQRALYASVLQALLDCRGKVPEIHAEGGKRLENLCDDLVLFYCCRAILFNAPIPIKNPEN